MAFKRTVPASTVSGRWDFHMKMKRPACPLRLYAGRLLSNSLLVRNPLLLLIFRTGNERPPIPQERRRGGRADSRLRAPPCAG